MAQRRWRDYRTEAGARPVRDFLLGLSDGDAAAVLAAMAAVRAQGLRAARHLNGDIYEVRSDGDRQTFRILFANEGSPVRSCCRWKGSPRRPRRRRPTKSAWPSAGSPTGGAEADENRAAYQPDDRRDDIVSDMASTDFLNEMIAERTKANPEFPALFDAAVRRRQLLAELTAERETLGLSQTIIAARMNTSQSAVARLESAGIDPKLSTVERYATALGKTINWELVDN